MTAAHIGMNDMLLFAWVSEVEGSVRSRRPRSMLGPERTEASPLLKAKSHVRRTFSAGHHKERAQQGIASYTWPEEARVRLKTFWVVVCGAKGASFLFCVFILGQPTMHVTQCMCGR